MPISRNTWFSGFFFLVMGYLIYMMVSGCSQQSDSEQKVLAEWNQKPAYVGEQQCRSCHMEEHNDWKKSDHFMAMQHATDSTVLGDFNNVNFSADGVTSRFFKKEGKFMVNTQGKDGQNHDFEVKFTFGYFPLQQYLVEFEDGKLQTMRPSWNTRELKWFHQYNGQKIHHHDWLHWTGNSQNWNTMCASCHSTDLKKNYDPDHDSYQTTWKDMNVSCESCHGPGSNHIDFMQTSDFQNGQRLPNGGFIYSRDTISQAQMNTCAPCHARKTDIAATFMHTGEIMNDLIPQVLNDEFYFPDGQIKEEDYEYGSFAQSKMFHNNVKCSNCHNPHSGKLKLEGNSLCLSCHKPKYDDPSHHFHSINTEGSKCINCHMPQKTYMGIDQRRDHSFRVPRPDQSVLYNTPNTCNSCHKNETTKWATDAVVKWYGPQRAYHFSDDLAPGSLLNDKSESHLVKLLADTSQPEIARATAANYLGSLITPSSANALFLALNDVKPMVRYQAIRSLQSFPTEVWRLAAHKCLTDKVRAVRIAAADLYHGIAQAEIPSEALNAYHAADNENKQFLHYQSDFPVGNVMLADYELKQNDYTNAVKHYLEGLKKDSLMNYARLNLSAAYNSMGKNESALKTLEDAAKIDPSNERIFYNLGLLCYEMNDIKGALTNFQKSVQLGSSNIGLYYNFGLLLQQLKKTKEAEQVLLKGYTLNPNAEKINYALAYLYLQQQLPQKARKHAMELKEINPGNQEYQQVFRSVGI